SKSRISHIDSSKLLGTPESNKLKAPNSSDFLTPRRTLLTNRMISLKLASITPKKGKKPSQSEPRASIHAIENSSESDLSDDQSNSISSGFEEELLDLNSSSIRTRSTKYRRKCDSTSQASQDSQVSTFTKRKFSFSAKKQTPVKNILRPKRKSIRNVNFEEVPSDQKLEILSNLCCRESEYEQIYNSIYSHLISQSGGCVYISGVPGTGKTATINNVIQNLSKKLHEVVDYQLIQINAMNLSSPKEFYTAFADYLNGFTLSVDDSLNFLNRKFGPDHIVKMKPTLLIIDEVDYLYTKSQDIFYSIFDWTNSHNSKLIVVTLSNMFDLPERMMSNKIISRLGMTRINFAPYTFKQLVEIANAHFKDSQIKFESDALQFICRKIAAGSGDARRLLEVASQALVIAKETDKHLATINMKHCDTILKQIFSSQKIQIVKSLSDYEKDFLRFIAMEYETANSTEPMTEACQSHSNQIFVETIVEKYKVKRSIETKSKFEGTNSDLLLIIRMLSTLGLISIKNIKKGCAIHQSLILLSSPTDLIVATN
ncbi:MAG: Origin recognition complex, subunit 1, partial [Marteilia pararefringens]